jgi:hypothetical protein
MAHDGVVRTASMSLGATESAMSRSEVRINFVASVPVLHSLLGYLMLVGLRFRRMNHTIGLRLDLQRVLPLSIYTYLQRGYRLNQHLFSKLLIMNEDLSK